MTRSSWFAMVFYGAVAAAVLACLWLISFAPLRLNWGRELVGGAIAIVAMAIGLRISQRHPGGRSSTKSPAVEADSPAVPDAPEFASRVAEGAELSVRERQVLRLLARGLSNKQLARELSVSENTVKTHLANLYAKLGVGRRTEALAVAHRQGLIAPE